MAKRNHIELIQEMKLQAVDHILDYIESQKDLWQKIPTLALLAHKRSLRTYKDHYKLAYTKSLWKIHEKIYVNCKNGELVNYSNKKLSSNASLTLLSLSIEEFDARKIIKKLKR